MAYTLRDLSDDAQNVIYPEAERLDCAEALWDLIEIDSITFIPSPYKNSYLNNSGDRVYAVFRFRFVPSSPRLGDKGAGLLYSAGTGAPGVCLWLDRAKRAEKLPLRIRICEDDNGKYYVE